MFKEDSEGTTHCCDHKTTNPSGVCDACLGKNMPEEKWEELYEKNVNYDEAELGCEWSQVDLKDKIREWKERARKETNIVMFNDSVYKLEGKKYQEWVDDKRKESRQSLIKELIEKINNMAIEHVGNSAKTVDQVLDILNQYK
jgi:hypothetical protein